MQRKYNYVKLFIESIWVAVAYCNIVYTYLTEV